MASGGQTNASTRQAPGRFVVVEGLDGAGTTTVAAALVEALQGRGLRVHATAEPTTGAFGSLLRRHLAGEITLDPTTTALVFTADREDHLQSVVRPALARRRWVVSDRYLLSTLAYQGAEGVDRDVILGASKGFEAPDVTFFLEAPEEVRRSRMAGRGSVERYEDAESARRVASSYVESIALLRAAGQRIEAVDATPAVADVVADVLRRLDAVR